jgi:uncharacterized Fe-S center protein
MEHGFDYTVTGAPLIIADGLRSENFTEIEINKKYFNMILQSSHDKSRPDYGQQNIEYKQTDHSCGS